MNLNDFPVTLKKGIQMGKCNPTSSIYVKLVKTKELKKYCLSKLTEYIKNNCKHLKLDQPRRVKDLLAEYEAVFITNNRRYGR